MKHKFSSMGRVAIALVLALSLSLVMAVPAAADVSEPAVTNTPETVGRAAEYTIVFDTNSALLAALDQTITITFPEDTFVPSVTAAYDDNVTVNTVDCADGAVSGSGQAVTITVPQDVPAATVTVVIAVEAGILNPTTAATTWTLSVQTTEEPEPVDSGVYTTIPVVVPTITGVVGTTYQNSNDTIVITFSEAVAPADGTWSANEFSSVTCDGTALTLTGADFAIDATNVVLTITLNESDGEYLVNDEEVSVTPEANAIENEFGDAVVAVTPATDVVEGDLVNPTVALTYSLDRPVKDADTLVITATFSEAMAATPTIAIVTTGDDLSATDMTGSGATWTYDYNVPAASDGTATVTIAGTDLAGRSNEVATNNTFAIDNTLPGITGVGDIVGTTISGAGDTIVIPFTEAVTAADGTWSANELTIESLVGEDATALVLDNAVFAYNVDTFVLTITLDEATDGEYLVNVVEKLTVTPAENAILDAALNPMAITPVVGTTVVGGDEVSPEITEIVGVDTSNIRITFDEAVVAKDGTWSSNEFTLIESPDNAPLNINHATFTPNNDPGTGMATVLTITLNEAVDGASLVAGEVICVTPATTAIVDLAGNAYTAGEQNSGADAGWLQVWVDDSWIEQADVDEFDPSLIWEVNAWDTIQEGINAVAIGGTVNVAAGTYAEDLLIPVGKDNLELAGASGATIKGVDIGAAFENFDIMVKASGAKIHGFTIQGPDPVSGKASGGMVIGTPDVEIYNNAFEVTNASSWGPPSEISQAIQTWDETMAAITGIASIDVDGLSIHDNTFTSHGTGTMGYEGIYINTDMDVGTGSISIADNTFTGEVWRGITVERSNATISGNSIITDWVPGVTWSTDVGAGWSGININDADAVAQEAVTVISNTIKGSGTGKGFREGIRLGRSGQTLTNISVTQNTVQMNTAGIKIWNDGADGVVVNNNNIVGNTTGVENTDTANILDATLNWWGDANGPTHASNPNGEGDAVSDDVDYSPWLDAAYPYGESTTTTNNYAIDLVEGWNLISVPLILTDETIGTVLADLAIISARTFKWSEADVLEEKWWKPGVSASDLLKVEDGWGYWIEMSAADALVVTGSEHPLPGGMQPSYDLHAGWNLIGFKSLNPNTVALDYLGPAIAGSYTYIETGGVGEEVMTLTLIAAGTLQAMYSYDAATEVYSTVLVDQKLVPGQGYWLAVSDAGTIYP